MIMKNLVFIVLMAIALLVSGCNVAPKPVYGQGNLPARWQEMFGNSNGARLDFMQNRAINEILVRLAKQDAVNDPNEVTK